jgi:hypothetical protein
MLTSTFRYCKWLFSFRFTHRNPVRSIHATCPTPQILRDLITLVIFGEKFELASYSGVRKLNLVPDSGYSGGYFCFPQTHCERSVVSNRPRLLLVHHFYSNLIIKRCTFNQCWLSDSERFLKHKQQYVILKDVHIVSASYGLRPAKGMKVHGRNSRNV